MSSRWISGLLLSAFSLCPGAPEESVTVDADSAVAYVLRCRKPNGAFGPSDQHYTDAAWNFPAVATLTHLVGEINRPEKIIEHGLGSPWGHVGYGHWQFYHVHKTRELLAMPVTPDHETVRLKRQESDEILYYGSPFGTGGDFFFKAGGRPNPDPRDLEAEEFGYYNLSSLFYLVEGLRASGRKLENKSTNAITRAIQAPNGGLVDIRSHQYTPTDADAHVAHTLHAISVSQGTPADWSVPECATFLQQCQDAGGGFRFHSDASIPGNTADIYYTWAAVKALDLLGRAPSDVDACIAWVNSLQNADGGFGDRPDWRSRLYSTFYAVDTLAILTGGQPRTVISEKARVVESVIPIPEGRFRIFQGLNKVPLVSPEELEGLHDRELDLLALKSDDFAAAESLRVGARERGLAMDIVLCPEAYPHRARRSGGALLHHICNPILDPGWLPEQRDAWATIDAAGQKGLPWKEYQRRVIQPLRDLGSIVYPEQDFEMEYAYSAYDAGLSGQGGYNAILVGFNWAPRDFVRVFPWRERYVDKLVPIADCDAHGDLAKWSPQLDHVRHLFIAEGPGYSEFREAARVGRVVCVIRNTEEGAPPATFYGSRPAVDHVKARIDEWKWWD